MDSSYISGGSYIRSTCSYMSQKLCAFTLGFWVFKFEDLGLEFGFLISVLEILVLKFGVWD